VILVTGGAKGLGAEICLTLASLGYPVVIHYRNSYREALEVQKKCQNFSPATIIQGDFSENSALEDFVRRYQESFSQTTGIVNNVGNYLIAPSMQTSLSQWQQLYQSNFFAPLFITQSLLPHLQGSNKSIVNIGVSGIMGHRAFTQTTAFAATKATLWFYTRSLAKELAFQSIRVNMVSPGYMENTIDAAALPLQRLVPLKDVARVVAFLFDPANAQITGQNIEVASPSTL
jgi:NAD(P)-dependent dehydrogenase (short-subunit alcohol dehydrogenase family)